MTTVGFGESTRYALRLYAYVLGVFVVGAVAVGLGTVLLWPEVSAWRGSGEAAVAPGVAGGLSVFLGVSVIAVGWIGATYKLLADGVAAGGAAQSPYASNTGEQPEQRKSTGSAARPERGVDVNPPPPDEGDEQPPEPSPSEIAFGTEDDAGARNDGPLPGRDGDSDPLGERSE
jgi:hypothetical protein